MKAAEWGRCLPPTQVPINCNWGRAGGKIYRQMGHIHSGGSFSAQQNASPGQYPQIQMTWMEPHQLKGMQHPVKGPPWDMHTHTHIMTGGAPGTHFLGNLGSKEMDQGSWGKKAVQSTFLWIRRDEARSGQHPLREGEHFLSASCMSQRHPGNKWRGWCGEEMRLVGKHYSELGTISPPPAEPWDDIMTSEGLTLSEPESLIQVTAGLLTLEWYLSVGLAQDWRETETPFLEGTHKLLCAPGPGERSNDRMEDWTKTTCWVL